MASTLKFEKVAPPISGSVVSNPSRAKTVAVPRYSFRANCAVKLAAPLVSVMVPAASSSNLLKSLALSGRLETSPLERCSPPLPCTEIASTDATKRTCRVGDDSSSPLLSKAPSLTTTTTGLSAPHVLPPLSTESSYSPATARSRRFPPKARPPRQHFEGSQPRRWPKFRQRSSVLRRSRSV